MQLHSLTWSPTIPNRHRAPQTLENPRNSYNSLSSRPPLILLIWVCLTSQVSIEFKNSRDNRSGNQSRKTWPRLILNVFYCLAYFTAQIPRKWELRFSTHCFKIEREELRQIHQKIKVYLPVQQHPLTSRAISRLRMSLTVWMNI